MTALLFNVSPEERCDARRDRIVWAGASVPLYLLHQRHSGANDPMRLDRVLGPELDEPRMPEEPRTGGRERSVDKRDLASGGH